MTEVDMTTVSAAVAGLVVAGLGVFAYTQFGGEDTRRHEHDTQTHTRDTSADKDKEKRVREGDGAAHKGRKKRKGKTAADDVSGDKNGQRDRSKSKPRDKGEAQDEEKSTAVVPGGFEATPGSPATTPQPKKKQKKKAGRVRDNGSETGKDAPGRDAAGDSTDAGASVSRSPSAPGSMSQVGAPSQPSSGQHREMLRPAPSLDTDGSWTHVDRRRLKSKPGQIGRADTMEVTSSDLASTESSPVAERVESVASDIRGTRGDHEKRTLTEKLIPRPGETSIDDMLEQPSFPTLARVMRVQPPADETPVPGFSWDDYGDVIEDSVLVHDADQEDEGEWGIVKSRNRTRPQTQTETTSHAAVAATPENMTKKQRQNARKRELVKAAKADAEVARLQGLAEHKRELERLRIIEQSRQGGGKQPGAGMRATVDDRGKLVWE